MKTFILLSIFSAILFQGCDVIEPPFKRNIGNNNPVGSIKRKAVIEDYTGYRCGNCPQGTKELEKIIKQLDTNVIGLAIHSGTQYASPQPKTPQFVKGGNGQNIDTVYFIDDMSVACERTAHAAIYRKCRAT